MPAAPPVTGASAGSTSRQLSTASGQRGANGQPGGRSVSEGGAPSIGASAPCAGRSTRGIAPSRPAVYGMRGAVEHLVDRPVSTIRPAYITATPVGEAGEQREVVGDHQRSPRP